MDSLQFKKFAFSMTISLIVGLLAFLVFWFSYDFEFIYGQYERQDYLTDRAAYGSFLGISIWLASFFGLHYFTK
ncbi:hypothetical protein JCM19236_6371 [Vibrio sp. JCM 19236]|nr:hypothetical protein JCM19236_6371 [Vibrio sp. JCM 19236]